MTTRALAGGLLSIGLVGAAVTLVATPSAGAAAKPPYSGFSTSAVATPLEVDVYEPTIPVPATPQAEIEVGYSKAVADSGGSRSRASLLWPGAAVGEGFKVIADTIGLPPEIGALGYPVQSNSSYPAGPTTDSKDTVPGAVMRTSAAATLATAQAGYSGDCDVQDKPGTGACPLPTALSAVADVAGSSATSRVESSGKQVVATAQASANEISLLGGLVRVAGLSARAVSTTNGHQTKGAGQASYTSLRLADQVVRIGPDGAAAPGQTISIPGLPADPDVAFSQLGIKVTVPKPVYDRQGSLLTSTDSALVLEVDCGVLRHKLDALPISAVGDAINGLPDQLGPIKSALGAALYLSPRYVFTLAKVQSTVDTVQGIGLPTLPTDLGFGGPVTPGTSVAPPLNPAAPGVPGADLPPQLGSSGPGPLLSATHPGGLPDRFTLPGALLLGAVAAAALAGGWLRRMSAVVLGTSELCPHGLNNGLPDLRKA
ncbi:MAG: choice-of-anchor P family protein [Mycobacteriales bacterium]